MIELVHERVWIIQRCINAFKNHYEDWPGYCENPMTRIEMIQALEECDKRGPDYGFRGHTTQFDSVVKNPLTLVVNNHA